MKLYPVPCWLTLALSLETRQKCEMYNLWFAGDYVWDYILVQ